MMIVVSVPTPASASSKCKHENTKFDKYTYVYEYISGSEHRVDTKTWYVCTDCGYPDLKRVTSKLEAHAYGSAVWTGNLYCQSTQM